MATATIHHQQSKSEQHPGEQGALIVMSPTPSQADAAITDEQSVRTEHAAAGKRSYSDAEYSNKERENVINAFMSYPDRSDVSNSLLLLARHITEPPSFDAWLSIARFRSILISGNLDNAEKTFGDATYLDGALEAMTWWIDILDDTVHPSDNDDSATDEFAPQRTRVLGLFKTALNSYYRAKRASCGYTHWGQDLPAHVTFMKHYTRFKEAVCNLVETVYPDLDLAKLRARV